eukprot:2949279-Amphidinium_carterae.1
MEASFNTKFDADVLSGKMSSDDALAKFLSQFDTLQSDGKVTVEEFRFASHDAPFLSSPDSPCHPVHFRAVSAAMFESRSPRSVGINKSAVFLV